jgi:hypothetical protein
MCQFGWNNDCVWRQAIRKGSQMMKNGTGLQEHQTQMSADSDHVLLALEGITMPSKGSLVPICVHLCSSASKDRSHRE